MKYVLGVCDKCRAATVYPLADKESARKRNERVGICITKETCYGDVLVVGVLKLETERGSNG